MTEPRRSLADAFRHYFEVVPAHTPELQDEAYAIRFQVYCRDMHFEPEEAFPDGRETDGFDAQSRHCLLRHKPSGTFAGCVRLVLNRPGDPDSMLPFERNCAYSLARDILDPATLAKDKYGEISRLAVISQFRRRTNEQSSPHGVSDEADNFVPDERRTFPHIALGLYLAAAALGLRENLDTVFVMMEPRLARHMRRYGIIFEQAGDVIDYHGQRGPFFITRESLYGNLDPEIRRLLELIHDELSH